MEEEFAKRKESVRQLYGPDVDRTFKVSDLSRSALTLSASVGPFNLFSPYAAKTNKSSNSTLTQFS